MQFRRDAATKTVIAVAEALSANWSLLPPTSQVEAQRLIGRHGPEIYGETDRNRASRVVSLLEGIAALPGLPPPVLDALFGGSGLTAVILVRINDEERDQILDALRQVFDGRSYADPRGLADTLRITIAQSWRQLDGASAAAWELLDKTYAAGGSPVDYLDGIGALLAGKLDFVRLAIERGKTWSRAVYRGTARPKSPFDPGGPADSDPFAAEGQEAYAPARPLTAGGGAAAPAAPVVRRYANVYFPGTVQTTQTMVPLIVHVAQEAAEGTVVVREGSRTISVTVGELGVFVHAEDFDVDLAIGGEEIPAVPFGRTVRVKPSGDSEPIVFFLTPTAAGDKRISIEFFQARKRSGSLVFVVSVVDELKSMRELANARVESVSVVSPSGGSGIKPPDLDLRVIRMGDGLTYGYVLNSADGRYTEKKFGQVTLQNEPLSFFKSVVDELSSLASLGADERTPSERGQTIARFEELGARLWDELLPLALKKEYFEVLRQEYLGKSLVITSDEPWIPWEMVRPFELGPGGRPLYSDRPLCEQFRLTRWLSGSGAPDHLAVSRGVVVAPADDLPSVKEEIAFFQDLREQVSRVQWTGPLLTIDEVNREFAGGTVQAYHFSCHGNFRYEDADESMLKFGDSFLRPSNIRYQEHLALWKSAPLVFLNACHSGQSGFTLTRMGGWAEAFLRVGASVFIGSLWEINDKLAAQFAREFYSRLWGLSGYTPQSMGEAFHGARMSIKEQDEANPTWLAYVLYGDPNGRVVFAG